MTPQLLLGAALLAGGWLLPRRVAGTQWRWDIASLLDAAPAVLAGGLLLLATGRPLFAGIVVFGLGAGLALADRTMRATLVEPLTFSAAAELPQLFTHPWLYLPFAGTGLVIGSAAGALVAGLFLLVAEPVVLRPRPALGTGMLAFVAAVLWLLGHGPGLPATARALRTMRATGDPVSDTVRFGPCATFAIHSIVARAERPARRAFAAPVAAPAIARRAAARPVVLVQCESFFDARRLGPDVPQDLLSGFAACCAEASQYGRLGTSGWGANTTRTEFAVLTGIADEALGYDRFNPYFAFARVPIASQVRRLRDAGYRTICLHPFDRRFYRRDLVMPVLGFDRFLGRESLGGSRSPPYHGDPEFARQILEVLDTEGRDTFIFAITMGNHGPWFATRQATTPDLSRRIDTEGLPQGAELLRYLDRLRRSDEMLSLLMDGLRWRGGNPVLGFYGDHLPSLPFAFAALGFDEPHSDYVIWPKQNEPARRFDLPAHCLGRVIVDRVLAGD